MRFFRAVVALGMAGGLVSGCRRIDWREMRVPMPGHLQEQMVVARLATLDSRTPPQVHQEGGELVIRYNSLNIAPQNFIYELRQLDAAHKEE